MCDDESTNGEEELFCFVCVCVLVSQLKTATEISRMSLCTFVENLLASKVFSNYFSTMRTNSVLLLTSTKMKYSFKDCKCAAIF